MLDATVPAFYSSTELLHICHALLPMNALTHRRKCCAWMARTLQQVCVELRSAGFWRRSPPTGPLHALAAHAVALFTLLACPPRTRACSYGCLCDLPCWCVLLLKDECWVGLRRWVVLGGRRHSMHAMRQRVLPRHCWQ